jgi:hypothetical protein
METSHSRIAHGQCRPSVLSALGTAAAAILWLSAPAAAIPGCSTVAADGDLDFDGHTISKSFDNSTRADNEVAVNASGDTLFIGQRVNKPVLDKLYVWDKTVAAGGDSVSCSTGSKVFKKNGVFHNPSINDSGELGFKGLFDGGGQGVFVRESSASAIEAAACTGDALGGGEVFASFPAVSRINASSQIAFVGITNVSLYVFGYDAPSDTLSPPLISVGDATTSGRQVCDFAAVGLGDFGEVVVRGTTDVDCSTPTDPRDSIFYTDGGSIVVIAQAGDPSPIAGSDYGSVFPARNVFMNASGKMLFAAKVVGAQNKVCLFLHDPSGPSTTAVACQKDPALGGKLGIPEAYQLADSDTVCYIADVSGGSAKQGIFCDGSSVLTLKSTSPALPTEFASYMQFYDLGMSADGSRIVLDVTAKDATTNKGRRGIVSCTLP